MNKGLVQFWRPVETDALIFIGCLSLIDNRQFVWLRERTF